jgi:hypothetical protein
MLSKPEFFSVSQIKPADFLARAFQAKKKIGPSQA